VSDAVTFVQVGDTHLHPGPRQADRLKALDQIIAENVTVPNLGAWLWPGDLFHQRSTIEDRNALAARLTAMANRAPVVICYGNHDLPGDLDVFGKLATTWSIHVVSTPTVLQLPLASGDVAAVFVLPYPTEAGLVSRGVAPGALIPTAREALDVIFMDAAAKLDTARGYGWPTLMVGHVNVAGSITSAGQPNIGAEIELDEALLARLGPGCYKGLNHIHKAQAIAGAHYPGSICRLDFGEIEPKGYLRIDYRHMSDGRQSAWVPVEVETCPLDVPPLYHVEGWLSREGFTFDVKKGPDGAVLEKPASWRGCQVRARIKFHESEKGLLEMAKAHVIAEFAEAMQPATYEYQVVPNGAVRAPEVAAARTLPEKVMAWAVETKTSLPADVLELLPALEHGDADAVAVEERQRMAALLDPPTAVAEERQEAVA